METGDDKMTIEQLSIILDKLKKKECPLTDELVKSGFQQKVANDGYTKNARNSTPEIEVDFTRALPTQEWHFKESFYANTDDTNQEFVNKYSCGEFLFWLAEKLDVCPKDSIKYSNLRNLLDEVKETMKFKNDVIHPDNLLNKSDGNQLIREQCWNGIESRLNELI